MHVYVGMCVYIHTYIHTLMCNYAQKETYS